MPDLRLHGGGGVRRPNFDVSDLHPGRERPDAGRVCGSEVERPGGSRAAQPVDCLCTRESLFFLFFLARIVDDDGVEPRPPSLQALRSKRLRIVVQVIFVF